MAELIDPRPVFTIVMGCNGVGKSAWKRANWDLLPQRYYDQDSVAGGFGDWNEEEPRARTRVVVDAQIDDSIRKRLDFGTESTYSGRPGRELVKRAVAAGYRIRGIYLGTDDPSINIARVDARVLANTGHRVDPARIPERWRYSLSNLRRTAEMFDSLRLHDNSRDGSTAFLDPPMQCELERGEVVWMAENLAPWCASWLTSLVDRQRNIQRDRAKLERRRAQEARAKRRQARSKGSAPGR